MHMRRVYTWRILSIHLPNMFIWKVRFCKCILILSQDSLKCQCRKGYTGNDCSVSSIHKFDSFS